MLLYDNIKKLRLRNGLTQQELAALTGYADKSMIAKIEKGIIDLPLSKVRDFARVLHTTPSNLMGWEEPEETSATLPTIPLFGSIPAGNPTLTYNDSQERVPYQPDTDGDYYALTIHGASMEPTLMDGDIVYVHYDADVKSGDIAIISVGVDSGTCKEVQILSNGIMLVGHNHEAYTPRFYSAQEVQDLPVTIQGKVVGMSRKFR